MVKVSGIKVHTNRLARMRRVKNPVMKALYAAGEVIRADAAQSIIDGGIPSPNHIVSDPGQPPNRDTGNLDKSIDVRVNPSRKSVTVLASAEYAAALEFGTSKIAARPFLRPALIRNKNRVVYGTAQAVREVVRVYKSDVAFNASAARYTGGT